MFNSYNAGNTNTNVKINACSGGIYKTYKESWISRFSLNSRMMKTMGKLYEDKSDELSEYQNVIILQMILTGDEDYVMAELIKKEDFEKYFESSKKDEEYDEYDELE